MSRDASWDTLTAELDAWAAAGRTATLWWRDDDARRPGPALMRLVDLTATVPLALAVVPADAEAGLADLPAHVSFLPHGWRHANHAAEGAKKSEFGPERPGFDRLADVALGWTRLRHLFGDRARPVFVPPWNRIEPDFVPRLANAGVVALSRFGPRQQREAAPGLAEVNVHVDIVDWRGSRGFVGESAALGALVAHLGARRGGQVDADEPTGVMTHHAVHDVACWEFLEELLAATAGTTAARWLSADDAVRLGA
jgi:hypothetical protein